MADVSGNTFEHLEIIDGIESINYSVEIGEVFVYDNHHEFDIVTHGVSSQLDDSLFTAERDWKDVIIDINIVRVRFLLHFRNGWTPNFFVSKD